MFDFVFKFIGATYGNIEGIHYLLNMKSSDFPLFLSVFVDYWLDRLLLIFFMEVSTATLLFYLFILHHS